MTELLFQTGISNACFALVLALLAMAVGATARRPHLSYMLWLLVFVKLVTPPIFNIPVPVFATNNLPSAVQPIESLVTQPAIANDPAFSDLPSTETDKSSSYLTVLQNGWTQAKPWLTTFWLLGSGLVVAWSLLRVFQFNQLLQANSRPAPIAMQSAAKRLAGKLNLKYLPNICTTSARISPLVWWVGGKVQVVIPQSLLNEMDEESWQWILAHELAHVRRRDYLVRWLEWFAVALFWWNPVVWWAQRNLRASEELCCDALVLSRLNPDCHSYADSILKTVESLVCPAFRPPAMASEINSGGYLERRVVMIMSGNVMKESSRLIKTCVLGLALVVFPLGLVYGQDFEKVEKKLQKSVEKGQLTQEQAEAMMETLERMVNRDSDRATELETDRASNADRARQAYDRAAAELEKAQADGKISKEDLEKRVIEMRTAVAEKMKRAAEQDRQFSREDFALAAAEMKKMVAEGKVKKEDMEKRLARMKLAMAEAQESGGDARRSITGEEYARAAEAMKKLVAEEKVKQEDVEKRLGEMRRGPGQNRDAVDRPRPVLTSEQLDKATSNMKKLVADGKMKQADMDRAMEVLQTMKGPSRSEGTGKTSDAENARADKFQAIAEKLNAAMLEGQLTHKEALEKLAAVQAAMSVADHERSEKDIRVLNEEARRLKEMVQRIEMAVESGEMTKVEANAKLKAIKAGKKEDDQAKKADKSSEAKRKTDIEELIREIRQAAADGKITREEAEAKLKAIKEQLKNGDRAQNSGDYSDAKKSESDKVMSQKQKNELTTNAALAEIETKRKEQGARIKTNKEEAKQKKEAEAKKKKDGSRD